jgi:hypothetical protein
LENKHFVIEQNYVSSFGNSISYCQRWKNSSVKDWLTKALLMNCGAGQDGCEFSDTLFGLSSGSEGCTEIAELSKPDEVDANHQDNTRELLASDLSSCRPVELCVKYITRCDTNKLLRTGNFGNANLGEDRVLSKTFVVKKITFTRNDQTAIDEIRSIFQKEISVRPF